MFFSFCGVLIGLMGALIPSVVIDRFGGFGPTAGYTSVPRRNHGGV